MVARDHDDPDTGAVAGGHRVPGLGAGRVDDADESALARESAVRLRNKGAEPVTVEHPTVHAGSLEQSNVSIVDRLSELTSSTRSFEALQKALSVMVNDVDSRAISELGRR